MNSSIALTILSSVTMFALAGIGKFLIGDWFHPACLFSLVWAFACGVAVGVAPENISSASGPLWILLNTAIFFAGSFFGSAIACSKRNQRRGQVPTSGPSISESFLIRDLERITTACTVLGILYIVLALRAQGIGIGQLTSFRALARAALTMSFARYSDTAARAGIALQLLLSASYLAPLFGGTLFAFAQRRSSKTVSIISFLPSLFAFSAQSTRSSIIYGVCMWAAGYLPTRILRGMRAETLNRRALASIAIAVPMGLLLISIGDVLRGGGKGIETLGSHLLSPRTKTYMGGHLGALSQWMDRTDLIHLQPAMGQFTFAGIYDLLRPGTRVGGIFADSENLRTGPSNVYTYCRGLIQDFTPPGALLVICMFGVSAGYAYRRVLGGRKEWIAVLASCYCAIIFAITSIFNYNSIILAFAVYCIWWCRSPRWSVSCPR